MVVFCVCYTWRLCRGIVVVGNIQASILIVAVMVVVMVLMLVVA